MFSTIVLALVVAYVPGALIFRAPLGQRDFRAALAFEERAFWAVVLSLSWSLAAVLVLAGAQVYTFDRLLIANAALSVLALAVWRTGLLYRGTAPWPTASTVIPLALVALGWWLYFPAAEYVIGGKDPGTYVNEGVQIAQRGALIVADPVVASVPPPSRDLFFPSHQSPHYYGLRFMGFYVRDPQSGDVIGQFPHLFPASIAVGYGLDGLTGARNAVAFWAILGLIAVYLTAARLIGKVAAAAAAGLLAINVIQLWFGRYPNSEVVAQALLFAAMLAFARAVEGSRGFFGALAGALLGLLLFLRYDTVLAIAAFAAAATLLPVIGARAGAAFAALLMTTSAAGLWYLAYPMGAYGAYPLSFTSDRGGWMLLAGGLLAMVAFLRAVRSDRVATLVRQSLPAVLAAAIVALAIYAYFFREQAGRLALHDAMAFRTFAWYLSPWALAAAVAGAAIVIATRFWRDPAFFLTLATFGVFFFYKTRIVPDHFWAARRFLAVILPGALICLAGLVTWFVHVVNERVTGKPERDTADRKSPVHRLLLGGATLALLLPVAVTFWGAGAPLRPHVEYAGLIPGLEHLAARVGPRDLLLVESRNAGSDLHALALPLAYIYAKNVLVLDSAVPDKRSLEEFVTWAVTRYERVLFLGGGGTDLLTRRLAAEPVGADRLQVPEYASATNAYPTGSRRKDFEFGLYRVQPIDVRPSGPIDLSIGTLDDLNVVRFHARERREDTGMLFRWTGPQSFILLVGVASDAREITVWMSDGGRPRTAPPAEVTLAIDDEVLGHATPVDEIRPYTFPLPAALAARLAASDDPARLVLRVPTWKPSELLRANDTRDLGVIVTRVQVR